MTESAAHRLGHDFSGVRVHTDARAAAEASALSASAFTLGRHITFAAGAYQPSTEAGRRLIEHELVHVLQQRDASPASDPVVGAADTEAEHEANDHARALGQGLGRLAVGRRLPTVLVQRQTAADSARVGAPTRLDEVAMQTIPDLDPKTAGDLFDAVSARSPTLALFGPQRVLLDLLAEIIDDGESVSRAELIARTEWYRALVLVRPDGYLVRALSGEAIDRAPSIAEGADGRLMAGPYEVGRFYHSSTGIVRAVDSEHRPTGPSIGELGLQHNLADKALDGTQAALGGVLSSLRQLITHPIKTVSDLAKLPRALADLIRYSPEFWEQFQAMPLGDQVQKVSEITTTLLVTFGTAGGTTTRIAAAGADIPTVMVNVLRLQRSGALAYARVAVPVGATVTALAAGPGGVVVLAMANNAAGSGGGGAYAGVDRQAQALLQTRGELVGAIEKHHIFPKTFKSFFKRLKITIDDSTLPMDRELHKILHGKGGHFTDWNARWERWIAANKNTATQDDVIRFAGSLMDEYGIEHFDLTRYRR